MNKSKLALLGTLALGLVLRLYHVTSISLWHDEAFSALLINYSWKEMFYRIGLDVHPPLYYIFLRLWSDVLGHSLFSLRGFSVLFGVATVYAVYLLVREMFRNEEAAIFAALLIAVNPFQIEYVTEARMYTFGAFVIVMAAYFLVRGLHKTGKPWLNWILYAVFAAGAMLTHYYLFFSVFALGLFGLVYLFKNYRLQFAEWKHFLGGNLLALILFLPWLKTFLFQFRQVQENYWIPKISAWSVPVTNWKMLLGANADLSHSSTKFFLVLGIIFTAYMVYRIIKKQQSFAKWLVLIGLFVPFLGALLLSVKQSIYLDRYFLFAALFYSIALIDFIFTFQSRTIKQLLFIILIVINLINWTAFWRNLNMADKPGMAAAAEYLNNNVAEKDKVIVGSSFEFFNFKYYNRTGHAPLLYTPGIRQVTDLPHFSGTALLTDNDLIHDFNSVGPESIVWILWTNGFGGTKPAVPSNWHQINEQGWQDVRPWVGTWIVIDEFHVQ